MNTLKREVLIFFSFLILFSANSTPSHTNENKENNSYEIKQIRSFKSLDAQLEVFEEDLDAPHYFTENLYSAPSASQEKIREQISATYNKVVAENRFVKFLDQSALMELPVGIKSEIGALEYVILIDSVIATPSSTYLYASMQFEAPKIGKIHFRGSDIRFSKEGGIVDEGRLELVEDYLITDENAKTQFLLKGNDRSTYVEFDCSGFKQFGIDASLIFSNTLIKPEDDEGNVVEGENVKLEFTTSVSDWNDILLDVDIPPFQVNGLSGVSFSITNAVLDWSDSRNLEGVSYPEEYREVSPFFLAGTPELWRGVYINTLEIKLPAQFDNGESTRTSFSGTNLILDNQGFTGLLTARNLIPISKGKIGNWDFSLDELSISLVANEFSDAGFSGKLNIPINKSGEGSDDSRLFTYSAQVKRGGDYLFNVSTPDEIEFDLWKAAEVNLAPSSYVEVAVVGGKFKPKAHLNGEMSVNVGLKGESGDPDSDGSKNVKLAKVTFENLEIQSVKPYVKVGSFSLGTSSSGFGGFPISINKIGGGQKDDQIFLEVEITLQLTGEDNNGFGAVGGFKLYSKAHETERNLTYRYDRIEIQKLGIDVDQGAFAFHGQLTFFKDDQVYGNGINGFIDADFQKIRVSASAVFGKVNGFSYWYVDAMADLGTTAPIFPGFFMNKFGGGAYYHMTIDSENVGSEYGQTMSGITYIPDRSSGLGLKALVGIIGANDNLFDAQATYEMAFNSNGGGLKYIKFKGVARMLSPPMEVSVDDLKGKIKEFSKKAEGVNEISNTDIANSLYGDSQDGASIYGEVTMEYNFQEDAFHATLTLDVNVAGGIISGGGTAVMHFDPNKWYIYIGRPEPDKRFRMTYAGLAEMSAYFVMGSVVPDTPPPPERVAKILGNIDLDYMGDLNALADGAGVGFGARFDIDTGDKEFLIFYGHFAVGAGFDVMLKDYGNTTCSGTGQLGLNGWYANGQAYAYFDGKIGVKVKLFRKTKKIDILEIGAAVVLQAKLPNPTWMKGVVGGKFSVLGGLVKGQCSFEVEIGNQCDIENRSDKSALEGTEVIAQLTPQEGVGEVDVFTLPQAVFNYQLEKTYETKDVDNSVIRFRIHLEEFEVKGPTGKIAGSIKWNETKDVAVLECEEILPPESSISMKVRASFQELKSGQWQVVLSEGEKLEEVKEVTFMTGKAPGYIPGRNVAYSYPTRSMLNFYQDEYDQGYVKLNQGQAYLFEDPNFNYVARFSGSSDAKEVELSYNASRKEATYAIPSDMENDQLYELSFIAVPKLTTDIASNVETKESEVDSRTGVSISTKTTTGNVTSYEEQSLYFGNFRTSKFNTLSAKLDGTNPGGGTRVYVSPGVHYLTANYGGPEPYSKEETKGINGLKPLINLTADLSDNEWYVEDVLPLIYDQYPFQTDRNPPLDDVNIYQIPNDYELPQSAVDQNYYDSPSAYGRYDYDVPIGMKSDYDDVVTKAANYITKNGTNDQIRELLNSYFPRIRGGGYKVELNYKLPGKDIITSVVPLIINNPIE